MHGGRPIEWASFADDSNPRPPQRRSLGAESREQECLGNADRVPDTIDQPTLPEIGYGHLIRLGRRTGGFGYCQHPCSSPVVRVSSGAR